MVEDGAGTEEGVRFCQLSLKVKEGEERCLVRREEGTPLESSFKKPRVVARLS
jgi:hypothetical protein